MKQHVTNLPAVLAGTALLVGPSAILFAGEPMPYVAPPPPPSDCTGCVDPGFYVEGSLLYMNSYSSDFNDYEGDWDLGYRGSIGFENPTGLFFELTGFYYGGDFDADNGFLDGELDLWTIDLMAGDTIHCGELCVAIAAGLRYAGAEFDGSYDEQTGGGNGFNDNFSSEFDGWGPVIEITAERALTQQFALYAELRQSLLFGEVDYDNGGSDTLAAVTEIGAGIQFSFAAGPVQNAFVRLGMEGQYWHIDQANVGLFGGVVSVGATF